MQFQRTAVDTRVVGRVSLPQRWACSRADLVEQRIMFAAIESGEYDGLSDDEWCELLEKADAGT